MFLPPRQSNDVVGFHIWYFRYDFQYFFRKISRGVYFVREFLYLPQFFLKPSTIPKKFCPPGKIYPKFLQVVYISRGKQKFSRSVVEGGKVGRLDVGKIGRSEGGKARKNLMEAYTFHNSFLIPSTQKF